MLASDPAQQPPPAWRRRPKRSPDLPPHYSPGGIAEACVWRPIYVVGRFAELVARCGGWVITAALSRDDDAAQQRLAVELRNQLVQLGPSFVKMGQMLSSRVDLLPPAYIRELQVLTSRVEPFAQKEAQRIVEEEWGSLSWWQSVNALESIGQLPEEPIAAASLGQVYCLTLKGVGKVALKVQRPNIQGMICADLFILRIIAGIVRLAFGIGTDLAALVDQYGERLVEELDFEQEAKAAVEFKDAAEKFGLASFCQPVTPVLELTTNRVLVTKWIDGERLEVTASRDLKEARRLQGVALTAWLTMLLETGVLHSDPHSGNLLRGQDGMLYIIDWGLVARISSVQRRRLRDYLAHILAGDYEAVPTDLVDLGFLNDGGENAVSKKAVADALSDVFRSLASGGNVQQRIADILPKLAELRQQYGEIGHIPASFVYILRAFSILEGLGLQLDKGYRIVDDCYPYLAAWLTRANGDEAKPLIRSVLYGPKVRDGVRVPDVSQVLTVFRGLATYVEQDVLEGEGVLASGTSSSSATVRMWMQRLSSADALQDVALEEVARSIDVLLREALEMMAGPAAKSVVPKRTPEDAAVLAVLRELAEALASELIEGDDWKSSPGLEVEGTEEDEADRKAADNSNALRRLMAKLAEKMLSKDGDMQEAMEVAGALFEARPLGLALLLRLTSQLLSRAAKRVAAGQPIYAPRQIGEPVLQQS